MTVKKRFFLSLGMLVFSLSLLVITTLSWLTQLLNDSVTVEVGFVDVNIDVFFFDEATEVETLAAEVVVGPGVTKPGVYLVNIVENSSVYFFDDFRVQIQVSSNVPTYLRVKIYEQLTLTYTNLEGVITELSIINDEYMPFNFETINWYDNRLIDNYIYYMLPVQRVDALNAMILDLIDSAPIPGDFTIYSPGYSLQIAFGIEAVQASGGPLNVWGLAVPPWSTVELPASWEVE